MVLGPFHRKDKRDYSRQNKDVRKYPSDLSYLLYLIEVSYLINQLTYYLRQHFLVSSVSVGDNLFCVKPKSDLKSETFEDLDLDFDFDFSIVSPGYRDYKNDFHGDGFRSDIRIAWNVAYRPKDLSFIKTESSSMPFDVNKLDPYGTPHLDKIVKIETKQYDDFVYNLETIDGWYLANNVTVSNCRCIILLD